MAFKCAKKKSFFNRLVSSFEMWTVRIVEVVRGSLGLPSSGPVLLAGVPSREGKPPRRKRGNRLSLRRSATRLYFSAFVSYSMKRWCSRGWAG